MKTQLKAIDRNAYRYYCGIDTGKFTGFAVWDRHIKKIIVCDTLKIHRALQEVKERTAWSDKKTNDKWFFRIEDARLRKFFKGENIAAKIQGAGSIKRDAKIWEDAMEDWGLDFEMLPPGITSYTEEYFKTVTRWKGRTSNHARDAAWIVFGI